MTRLRVEAAREHQIGVSANFDTALIQHLDRRARQLHTAWDVLHKHMVALEMRELTGGEMTSDDAEMVLLAERLVEHLVLEVGDRP